MNKIPVEFRVIRGISFHCLQCNATIQEMYYGQYHIASGGSCRNCGAYYSIDWNTQLEQSQVMVGMVELVSESEVHHAS